MYGAPLAQADNNRPAEKFPSPVEDQKPLARFKDSAPENDAEEEENKATLMKQWQVFNQDTRLAEKIPDDSANIFKREADTTEMTHELDEEGDENMESELDEKVDPSVREDMGKLESTFRGISKRFRLINRIGEGKTASDICKPKWREANRIYIMKGTFSTVYKAEDLLYDGYQNDWDADEEADENNWEVPPTKKRRLGDNVKESVPSNGKKKPRYVALKKIYVTSSPLRIQNELELLHQLRGSRSVCPLITAFRHQDQVVAVLPYFPHTDFRIQYRTFLVRDMRHYFKSLFTALAFVHKHFILHRDIKPT
jgi:cell division control protein 7